jgi:hypothetical protein
MDTLSRVYRLFGGVQSDLKKDETYVLHVDNSYDVAIFGGKKRLIFQEINRLGGSNKMLGLTFICSAVTLVLIQMVFMFLYIAKIANVAGGVKEFYNPDNLTF